jgi:hypothetical protein
MLGNNIRIWSNNLAVGKKSTDINNNKNKKGQVFLHKDVKYFSWGVMMGLNIAYLEGPS